MLPYRLRRQLPLLSVSALAVAATLLLLPSTERAGTPLALSTAAAPAPEETPSYITGPPVATADDLLTGSIAAAPELHAAPAGDAIAIATLTVTAHSPTPSAIDAAAAAAETPEAPGDPVHVGDSAVNVRAGPTTAARKLFVLQPGEAVTASEVADGWVKIVRPDGEGGWVYARYLVGVPGLERPENLAAKPDTRAAAATQPTEPRRAVSGRTARLAGPVTVRDRPSALGARLFTLQRGERVTLAEMDGGWARVVLPSGVSGWIPVR
jgi:SH3-like domain-containing protein